MQIQYIEIPPTFRLCYSASLRQGKTQLTLTNQTRAIQGQKLETKWYNDGLMTWWVNERRKPNWCEKQWV